MVRISEEALIRALMHNARTPFTVLAKRFHVTEAAIRKKVNTLVKRGVIEGYTLKINPKKLGYGVHAWIGVDSTPDEYIAVIKTLKGQRDVISLYSSTGDHMIMIEVWLKDTDVLSDFLKELRGIPGVKRICPSILVERIK